MSGETPTLRACHEAAARIHKGEKHPGLMGAPLTSAVITHVACAMHSPHDHFFPLSFEGPHGFREEWLRAYETVDPKEGPANPLTASNVYLVRWGACEPAAAVFRPLIGRIAVYVHAGAAHLMVGHSEDGTRPSFTVRAVLTKGARFELVQPGTWWAVAPIGSVVATVTGMSPQADRIITDVRSLPPITVKNIAVQTLGD